MTGGYEVVAIAHVVSRPTSGGDDIDGEQIGRWAGGSSALPSRRPTETWYGNLALHRGAGQAVSDRGRIHTDRTVRDLKRRNANVIQQKIEVVDYLGSPAINELASF